MVKILELDEVDRLIIDALQKDPELTQSNLAKMLNLSQPSIGNRIKKLKGLGFISMIVGIDLHKAGLMVVEANMHARDSIAIIKIFKHCPYFVGGIIESGEINLILVFVTDDLSTIKSIIEHKLKDVETISNLGVNIITSTTFPYVHQVSLTVPKAKKPECSIPCDCTECDLLEAGRCKGCPYSKSYKGVLWKKV